MTGRISNNIWYTGGRSLRLWGTSGSSFVFSYVSNRKASLTVRKIISQKQRLKCVIKRYALLHLDAVKRFTMQVPRTW